MEINHHSAWLLLDEADNDLPRYLAYLAAALQRVYIGGGGIIAVSPAASTTVQCVFQSKMDYKAIGKHKCVPQLNPNKAN
jgi:hypothetical protein